MLITIHEHPVRRTVLRLLGYGSAEVDDLVQEVFLAAWRGRRRLRDADAMGPWLRSIAIRRCRSHVTRIARRRRLARMLPLGRVAERVPITAPADDGGAGVDPELARALADLSHDHREVLVLHHLEGLTAPQIAAALGLTANAVDARLHRARGALRRCLEPSSSSLDAASAQAVRGHLASLPRSRRMSAS